jgi:hypothetical protein
MIAKTLAGDLICLEAKTQEEFKSLYLQNYVKEKFRPFVTLQLFQANEEDEYLCLIINIHKVLPSLEDRINWTHLCQNTEAIHLVEENLDKLGAYHWGVLSLNPSALPLLEKNIDKINWENFCMNPNPDCYHTLRQYPKNINWSSIVRRSSRAYELMIEFMEKDWYLDTFIVTSLLQNPHCKPEWIWPILPKLVQRTVTWSTRRSPDRIWSYISLNPNLIEIVEAYPDNIDWEFLSGNPAAIEILKENRDKINLNVLATNPRIEAVEIYVSESRKEMFWSELARNPCAVPFLEKNVSKLSSYCWELLCRNPEAVGLLEKFPDKISRWYELLYNKNASSLIKNNIERFDNEVFVHPCVVCPPLNDF